MSCCCVCWLIGVAIIGFIIMPFFKKYMQGGKYTKETRADGKVVIITGANVGIGKETARDLARRGATVYLACRDMNKSQQARDEIVAESKNERIYCRKLDLASLESIREFAEAFQKEESRLDILINNAGVYNCPYSHTKDGFETTIGVNHLGHFYLTNLLLDLLKKSKPSRIVVVASAAHKIGKIKKDNFQGEKSFSSNSAYSQSKLANILFTRELAKRLEGTGVVVNALHPGVVETTLFRNIGILNSGFGQTILQPMITPFMKTPENGAQTSLYVALDPELETVSGKYFSDCAFASVTSDAKNDETAKWLWDESEKLINSKLQKSE